MDGTNCISEGGSLTTCFACLLPGRCFWCSNWKVDKWKGIMVHMDRYH